jgi:CubicO group peptidase (beta-lactamase class C family)
MTSIRMLRRIRIARAATLLLVPIVGARLSAQSTAHTRNPLDGFDAYVAAAVKAWEVPGLAVAVVKDDSIVLARGFGVRTLGSPEPVDEHTRFAIGSTTKAMTAAAVAMLVDEGKVRWDDPVTKHLPSFQLSDPYVTRELTVRDLLSHRSGLPGADALWYASPNSFDDILRRLRYLKPAASLRSRYAYQNVMYAVAGQVVAAASGTRWSEFVQRRILRPVGMSETLTSHRRLAGQANVATPHLRVNDTVRAVAYRDLDNIAPAGAVVSSALDMARWIRVLLDSTRVRPAGPGPASPVADGQAGARLVSDSSFRQLFTPQFLVPAADYYPAARQAHPHFTAYGLGWFLQDYRGRLVAMHTGSIDGMTAIVGMLPEERVGVVVLANLDHAELRHALMYRVFDLYLDPPNVATHKDWSADLRTLYGGLAKEARAAERKALASRVPRTRPTLPATAYAGTYADSLYGDVTVRVEAGRRLVAHYGPAYVGELEHWHYDTFRARWRDPALGTSFVTFTLDPARMHVVGASVEGLGDFGRR